MDEIKDPSYWKKGIKLATEFIESKGWTVKFSSTKESVCLVSSKTIIVNSRAILKVQYYVLLHEIGHAVTMDSVFYSAPSEKHGPRYNTLAYRVEIVKEEINAWEKAKTLAIVNDWPLDKSFHDVEAKFLAKYMAWVNRKKKQNSSGNENDVEK